MSGNINVLLSMSIRFWVRPVTNIQGMGSLWYWRAPSSLSSLISNPPFPGNSRFEIESKLKPERFEIRDTETWVHVFPLNKLAWLRYEIPNGAELYWSGFYKLRLALSSAIFASKSASIQVREARKIFKFEIQI